MFLSETLHSLNLLNSAPETRSAELNEKIFTLISPILYQNPVFQQDSKVIKSCCKKLRFEQFEPLQFIFKFNDPSSKFYIVLSGSLSAYVPISTGSEKITEKQVKTYSAGEYFGELGLIKTQTRSATIKSNTQCILASLTKADFRKILFIYTESKINETLEFLQKIPIFACIPNNDLTRLSYFFTEIKLTKNQVLYKEHSKAEKLFFIQNGEFKLTKTSHFDFLYSSVKSLAAKQMPLYRHNRNTELQIVIKSDNEILGGEELIDHIDEYIHSCVCISNFGVVLAINASDFRNRVKQLESWKKLSEFVVVKKAAYENRVKNLSDIERYKGRPGRESGIKRNESFVDRSGLLRKISPAREMTNTHVVVKLNEKVERLSTIKRKKLCPLLVNNGHFSQFNLWVKKKFFV